jgi:hypothetical protein
MEPFFARQPCKLLNERCLMATLKFSAYLEAY